MTAPLRLRGEVRGKPIRFDIPAAGAVLGSDAECDLVIPDPTVSRRHAELQPMAGGLEVRDLGSTNGTWLEGRRVERVVLSPGSAILFGRVSLALDDVAAGDRVLALEIHAGDSSILSPEPSPGAEADSLVDVGQETTLGVGPMDAVATELVPRLLEGLWSGSDAAELAQWAGSAVLQLLPLVELEIRDERGGVLFLAAGRADASRPHSIERRHGGVSVRADFAHGSRARAMATLVDVIALSVALAADRERPLPRTGEPREPPPLPGEGSIEPPVVQVFARAAQVAQGDVGVLILGESGTGKEVLARYVHEASGRTRWVALNCAALPRDLLEAELFGVEKGTATGVEARPGKLELAHDGTLFLDEIGDMSLETQAKILRVLQEGEVYRLGATQPRPARARVLAATNKDVARLVEEGTFRLDLYHRIAGWVVELPPLRERQRDIPNLAVRFLAEEGKKLGRRFRGISQAALDLLLAYSWPGNIRQLRQEIARCALFLEPNGVLEAGLLAPELRAAAGGGEAAAGTSLAARVEAFERREIEGALAACGGQVAEAADRLGVHRATLYRRIKALGIAVGEG